VVLLVAAILAVGVNFGRLATTAEYTKYSIRGKSELTVPNSGDKTSSGLDREYAFNWSYGIGETITLLIPDFYGGSSSTPLDKDSETYNAFVAMGAPPVQAEQIVSQGMPTYWGPQPMTSGPVYVGAIVCFLFVLGLFIVDRRWTSWLVAGTVLSLLLAWGHHFAAFNYFMFDYFPGYNKFRAVSSALVIAQITIPLLAMLALWRLFRDRETIAGLDKKLLISGGITAGICLLVWLFGGMASFTSAVDAQLQQAQYPLNAIRADRESMMKADAFRSLVFIVLALAILYFYVKNKLSATIAIAGVGVLVLADLWTVDKRYLHNGDFKEQVITNYFQPTPADRIILEDKDPAKGLSYRVFDATNPFNSARASYFHKSVGGYHGAKLRRYQDVIDRHISQMNLEVLRMLNTRYAITADPKQPVQRVPGALGNAWFVEEIEKVNTPDAELDALTGFDAEKTAIVDVTKFPVKEQNYSAANATIKLTTYEPDYLKYEYQAAQPGFVVFSEIYYPAGWQAYIDGKPVDHIRANYILRAMQVPAGKHTIEFKFEPQTYYVGNTISLISSIVLLLVIAGAIVYGFKKKQREEALAV
ncbi:MAG TPA: YfhO family protein, partial [Pontibacter sp.]